MTISTRTCLTIWTPRGGLSCMSDSLPTITLSIILWQSKPRASEPELCLASKLHARLEHGQDDVAGWWSGSGAGNSRCWRWHASGRSASSKLTGRRWVQTHLPQGKLLDLLQRILLCSLLAPRPCATLQIFFPPLGMWVSATLCRNIYKTYKYI